MRRHVTRPRAAWIIAGFCLLFQPALGGAADAAATQPAAQAKTGALDLTFTERSPLSAPKEIARRLNLKPADVATDYDLSQRPFKAYVPRNYDPATPVGVFVYLGYKDSVSTPPLWQPILDESHLIFITPVCHSGQQYQPSVPMWQSIGLALDAVYNLKRQYAVDAKRVYLMTGAEKGIQTSIATADVFNGFIVVWDQSWFEAIRVGNSIYPSKFSPPPAALLRDAEQLPFVLSDDKTAELAKEVKITSGAMGRHGFEHLMQIGLSSGDDVHYPNFAVDWFSQQALPFLDKFSAAGSKSSPAAQTAAANPDAGSPATAPSASPGPSEAQSLLTQAQLLISNNRVDLARDKLQKIIEAFPNDPAAAKAKQLLDQIAGQ